MYERDLVALADQIRNVRAAEKRFMSLWRVEQVVIGPEALDRLAADIDEIAQLAGEFCALQQEVDQANGFGSGPPYGAGDKYDTGSTFDAGSAFDAGSSFDAGRAGGRSYGAASYGTSDSDALGYRPSRRWPMNESDRSAGDLN